MRRQPGKFFARSCAQSLMLGEPIDQIHRCYPRVLSSFATMFVLPRSKVADGLVAGKLIPQARFVSSGIRFRHALKVANHGGLGPVNAVGRTATEKCAVASVARLDEFDIRVGREYIEGFS